MIIHLNLVLGPHGPLGKESAYQHRRHEIQIQSWVGKIPWRRKWQPTPVFLTEKPHGQRDLADSSSNGCKELDMTESLSTRSCFMVLCRSLLCSRGSSCAYACIHSLLGFFPFRSPRSTEYASCAMHCVPINCLLHT